MAYYLLLLRNILLLLLLIQNFYSVVSIQPTCRGKRIGEKCACDEDCEGPNYQCVKGKCVCPFDFEEYSLDSNTKTCRPAQNAIGATCQNKCKAPLLCQNKKCVCFGGKASGSQCVITCKPGLTLVGQECIKVSAVLGGTCTNDVGCQIPGSYCSDKGKCECIPGAISTGSSCSFSCPDGSIPTKTCKKILVNDAIIQSNSEKQDTCPKGYACATFGKPDIGHCCPLYCPYGSPDLSKSCNAGADIGTRCPEFTTHYCQLFEDHGSKNELCCPRPCREPTPEFINGTCLARAHWGDSCVANGQCEGGSTMQCKSGKCVCLAGYIQVNTSTFPSCEKPCNKLVQASIDGNCYRKVNVGDPCYHTTMCPSRSICREGQCQCDCSSALSRGTCINPDDPLSLNSLTEAIQQIFNPSATKKPEIN